MANYYAVLTLSPQASLPDIKTRYRQLSLRYHPDRGGSMEKMMQLNEAYRILSNPLLRREYDQKHTSRPQANTTSTYAYTAYARPATTHTPPSPSAEQPLYRHTTQSTHHRTQTQPAKKSHFWSWFSVVTIIVLAFLGYQIYTTVQPASATTLTPATTTPTSTTPTTTAPITTISQDTDTQPSATYTNGTTATYRHRSYYDQTNTDATDTPTSSTTQELQ